MWEWKNDDPFGNNAVNEDPASTGTAFKYNNRFPGQYFDSETNTSYNYFRDYDPTIGRYVQSDPVGLNGGINSYAYARSNSISAIDLFGLSSIIVNPALGTATILNGAGQAIESFPAGNNAQRSSRGPLEEGTYRFSYLVPHKDGSADGPFGSNGNFVFDVPGCKGCGFHSGRAGKKDLAGRSGVNFATDGCVRSTDDATKLLRRLTANGDPLTSLTVSRTPVPTNLPPLDSSIPGGPIVYPQDK